MGPRHTVDIPVGYRVAVLDNGDGSEGSLANLSTSPTTGYLPGILSHFKIVLALQSHPEARTVPKEARQQQGRLCCDGLLAVDDGVNPPGVHSDGFGQSILSDVHGEEKLLVEDLTRMDRG